MAEATPKEKGTVTPGKGPKKFKKLMSKKK